MTDQEIVEHYERMKEIYGEALPDMDHCPASFAFVVKMYKYFYMDKDKDVQTNWLYNLWLLAPLEDYTPS